jgi:hypothetical protein
MKDNTELLKFTIPQLLRWRVKETGTKVALREKDFGVLEQLHLERLLRIRTQGCPGARKSRRQKR